MFQKNLKRDRERQLQRQQAGMQNLMKTRDKRLNRKLQKQYANRSNWQDRRNQVGLSETLVDVKNFQNCIENATTHVLFGRLGSSKVPQCLSHGA